MKIHKILALLILLCILLSACHIGDADSTVEQTVGASETGSTAAAEPSDSSSTKGTDVTQLQTQPPTEVEESVLEVQPYYENWAEYLQTPDGFYVYVYNEDSEYDHPGPALDMSGMVTGCFYSIDVYKGSIYLIADQPVLSFMKTSEHIYYVLKNESTKVYRTDHTGANKSVVYESAYGSVTGLSYYGKDANGKLIMSEERNRIIAYDILSGETIVLMKAYLIGQFSFTPYSLTLDHVAKNVSKSELGPTIYWKGKLQESDPDKPGGDTYYYFVNSGEHWDVRTWSIVN